MTTPSLAIISILFVGCGETLNYGPDTPDAGILTSDGKASPTPDSKPSTSDGGTVENPVSNIPQLSNALTPNCFGWPQNEFSPKNKALIKANLAVGSTAVDFTLKDRQGQEHTLSKLLAEKPVLLFLGSFTCPYYNGAKVVPHVNSLASRAYGNGSFADQIHFVHVYTIEAHPMTPDPSPYFGKVKEAEQSFKRQATTYAQRVTDAADIESQLEGDQLLLVDDLDLAQNNNPVWCTYGTVPSGAYLIQQDGTIEAVHDWWDEPTMQQSMEIMLNAAN